MSPRPVSVQGGAAFVPGTRNHNELREQADGYTRQAAPPPDGCDEESPAQAAHVVSGNERVVTPAGEHRAAHGEGRMKIRATSWAVQLVVWVTFLGMVLSISRYRAIQKQNEGLSFFDSGYKNEAGARMWSFAFGGFFAVSLVPYFVMCVKAGTRQFVANLNLELNVKRYVEQLQITVPEVRFNARCYHYETRTRSVPVRTTDVHGRSRTTHKTETYRETVVTHTASDEYPFTRWEDTTPALPGTNSTKLTKLHLSKKLGFLTDAAEQQTLAAYDAFRAAHRFDVHQSYTRELYIEGFKERILCLRNVDRVPWWVGSGVYWVASLLMANVPYRQFLDCNTGTARHTITKKIA